MNFKPVFPAIFCLLLIGCGGGGGGGDSSPTSTTPTPVADEKPGGLWEGTTTDQSGNTQNLVGITTDSGDFRFFSFDTGGQFLGDLTVNGSSATGSGLGYAAIGFTWIDGSIFTDITLTGTVNERTSFSGDWEASTGESGTFSFAYNSLYERDSSLSLLSDVWIAYDQFGNPIGSTTIDSSGRIDGQDAAGCLYSGQINLIDPAYNVYDIALNVVNCGSANGDYTGLGFLADDLAQNDTFYYAVDKGTFSYISVVYR